MNNKFILIILLVLILSSLVYCEKTNNNNNEDNDSENDNDNEDNNNKDNEPKYLILNGDTIDPELLKQFLPNLNFLNNDNQIEVINIDNSNKEDDEDDEDDEEEDDKDGDNKNKKKNSKGREEQFLFKEHQFLIEKDGSIKLSNSKVSIPKKKTGAGTTASSTSKKPTITLKNNLFNFEDIFEDDNSLLFNSVDGGGSGSSFIENNIIQDKDLPGRDKLIQGQKYRGYLLYDRSSSSSTSSRSTTTHPYSNSIITHNYDLSNDRDLFEFRGQSNLTPLLDSEKAYQLLKESAELGNHRAMYLLGVMDEIGENINGIMNFTKAEEWFLKSAEYGNSDAQRSLGFLYATGKLGYIDEAKAVLYYTFSAKSGNIVSQLIMAYRYLHGYGVEKNCKKSSILYEKVAGRVVLDIEKRGFGYQINSQRFSDERKKSHNYQDESDIVDYLRYSSDDPNTMGRLYLEGSLVTQDFQQALDYFKRSASSGNGGGYSGLGFMYNMGYGVEQSNKTAFDYYVKASELDDRDAKSNLAELYFHGYGVKQNVAKAIELWRSISDYTIETYVGSGKNRQQVSQVVYHGSSNAQLGRIYAYGLGGQIIDRNKASLYFSRAISGGDISSFYHYSKLHLEKDESSCPIVIQYLKRVAEKGSWAMILSKAQSLYEEDDTDHALFLSEKAAEMGIELAQYNAAWMYDKRLGLSPYYKQQSSSDDTGRIEDEIVDLILSTTTQDDDEGDENDVKMKDKEQYKSLTSTNDDDDDEDQDQIPINEMFNEMFWNQQAFRYYDYSAEQLFPLSRIKIGDYFYYGVGVEKSLELAAESYSQAAQYNQPMALFNLGYLHQWGEGVPQDFFLAKRYYDLSLNYQPKGYIPIYLSLIGLFFHFIYLYIYSIFDPTIKIPSLFSSNSLPIVSDTTSTTSTSTTTTTSTSSSNIPIMNDFHKKLLAFDADLIRQIESYSMIFFLIVIGLLVVRRQRILLNQQRNNNNINNNIQQPH